MRALAIGAFVSACSSQSVDAVIGCQAGCAGNSGQSGLRPVHRYSFDASGTNEVLDSIGDRHGTLVGGRYGTDAELGSVVLAGDFSGEYVDLPQHLLWGLRNASFEAWVTWRGGARWQRVFDFGEDETGIAGSRSAPPRSYLFLTFRPAPRVAFKKPPLSSAEVIVDAAVDMPEGVLTHLGVVVDEDNRSLTLYMEGRAAGSSQFFDSLSDIYDVNDWLGRSLFPIDADLGGSISEFRIYDRALTAEQMFASYAAGPDALAATQ